ncbi:MAG TPA: protein-glutamate O-methyltransferase CheR [Gemmataceae bacterium]|nr:protein-glutamate O-methyltransferase CheR [Gemmataceae bacterium]
MSLSPADRDFIRTMVYQRSGIVLEEGKAYLLETRLSTLAAREGFPSLASLLVKLRAERSNGLETRVVEAMTTNETSFFRDIQPFEALRQLVLPDMMRRRAKDRKLAVWCAAASCGQEPYSLAMLVHEHFPTLIASWKLQILATDLSLEMVERSRAGLYSQVEVNRGLPARLLVKFFENQGLQFQLKAEIRRMVEFRQLNLIGPWPLLPAPDIVLLRNVLIYFDVATKKTILGKVRRLIRPDGYLFLGGAETTMNLDDAFERVPFERAGCYRVKPCGPDPG